MTRQAGERISTDPVDCLVEIAETALARVNNQDDPPGPHESFTLGQITGIAMRHPRVMQLLKQREEEDG
jgi:hypothetical protein